MESVIETPLIVPESDADYFADTSHVSASMLKVFEQSPARYHAQFIARTIDAPESEAMRFGRQVHCAILEPERFKLTYACPPKCDRRTKEGKATWATWCAANATKHPIDQETMATLLAMQQAAYRHPKLARLLHAAGDVEKPIRWENRILRKARPDKLLPNIRTVLDLKSVVHPAPHGFASAVARYGWWIQADTYLDAALEAYPEVEEWRFVFAAIAKDAPHEIGLYELTPDDLDWAERRTEQLVTELIDRTNRNDWVAPWGRDVTFCPLPQWLRSDFYHVPFEE